MNFDDLDYDTLWSYYQRGYNSLMRSGRYFRQILRPALSHVFFLKAVPLLREYARANRGMGDLPPGFGDQMAACPLSPRDLLHLDYAISLGYVEQQGLNPQRLAKLPVLEWPGPGGSSSVFIAADALFTADIEDLMEEFAEDDDDDFLDDDEEPNPPYDL